MRRTTIQRSITAIALGFGLLSTGCTHVPTGELTTFVHDCSIGPHGQDIGCPESGQVPTNVQRNTETQEEN